MWSKTPRRRPPRPCSQGLCRRGASHSRTRKKSPGLTASDSLLTRLCPRLNCNPTAIQLQRCSAAHPVCASRPAFLPLCRPNHLVAAITSAPSLLSPPQQTEPFCSDAVHAMHRITFAPAAPGHCTVCVVPWLRCRPRMHIRARAAPRGVAVNALATLQGAERIDKVVRGLLPEPQQESVCVFFLL